ncbi:MAG TPA: NAD(P)/FAD-dependent oxidoreductase [Gammaproteobacteria bacterium]|jgi:thioredoxin reductase (NADPH)|nr:NAD(P)/FAD-dependent oxidoreductase [Gammaproteobacteria bacterium]MDP7660115.1 NAD(P)/FAD-dependent oxidoreductase [Gammaproteobacteria bacterium]HJP39860.1 NAD(P)/FAD-dependent oxidoreductase [Gammaproteobacteria bacterium]
MTIKTDALIIGAGPSGLFQIFELGLLGIKPDIVDTLPTVGGQCTELYPDKPIYDIPGIPMCTGQGLVDALMEQAEPFNAGFHLGEEVIEVSAQEQGGFRVVTNADKVFDARTVFIAGGVGSFQPRKLRQPEAQDLEDRQLFYRVRDPSQFHDKKIIVLGGGDSALDWANELAPRAESLTLVHRREDFRGVEASVDTLEGLVDQDQATIIRSATLVALGLEENRLVSVDIKGADDEIQTLPADALLVFFGLSPKLGPIAEWGLEISRKTIAVDTERFETAIPGIFAIGDINSYPGKKKLILSGFHEAALAAFAAKSIIEPDKKIHLQYTTTSPIMHRRLGVEDE